MWRITLLLLLCLGTVVAASDAGFVTCAWEVQQEADRLHRDLAQQGLAPAQVLQHVQDFLAENGDATIAWRAGVHAPAYQVFSRTISDHGYTTLFQQRYGEEARTALQAAMPADVPGLRRVAMAYPFTDAAAMAWTQLANLAWDRNRLGDFREYARRAPDSASLSQRLTALRELQERPEVSGLPPLSAWETVWRQDVDEDISDIQQPRTSLAMAVLDERTMVLADGRYATLLDPLTGAAIGS
ncbi:MAG: hypothetical protein ACOCXJ_09345, partial [Planctomycetota bacterium]